MTKSFDDVVSNFKSPSPEWQVTINGNDYSNSLELLEFTQSINEPLKFSVKIGGIDSTDNIPKDSEVIISYAGAELVRGVLKELKPDVFNTYLFKGTGYSAELEADSEERFNNASLSNPVKDTDVSTVTDALVNSYSLPNSRSFSTSYSGGTASVSVDDFRVKQKQLEDVNRLMGSYSLEWYVTLDGSNNPVFNVTDQVFFSEDANNAAGNPKEVLKISGKNQTAEKIDQNINRNKGDFDGVIVRGYGDGDDQITASAGNTSKDDRVLIYTDKTILSQSNADDKAQNLVNTNTVDWQEITVKPSTPNDIYGLGDELRVEAENARLDDNYRVVEAYYKIHPEEDSFESKLSLSNKPQTFVDDFKKTEEQTKSQTDNMQGARNIWSDKETANATNAEPFTMDFRVPEDVVDVTGDNRLDRVELNYASQEYQQNRDPQDVNASNFDPGTKVVSTGVQSEGIQMERSNISQHNHAVGSATSRGGSERQKQNSYTGGFVKTIPPDGWKSLGVLNAPNPENDLAHSFQFEISDITEDGSQTDRDLYVAFVAKDFVANFSIDPVTPIAGESATLTENANHDFDANFDWGFGDGGSIDGSSRTDDGAQVEHTFNTDSIVSSDTSTNEITISNDYSSVIDVGNKIYVPESDNTYTADSVTSSGGNTVVTVGSLDVDESGNTAEFEGDVFVTMELRDSGDKLIDSVTKNIEVGPPATSQEKHAANLKNIELSEIRSNEDINAEEIVAQATSLALQQPDTDDTFTIPYTDPSTFDGRSQTVDFTGSISSDDSGEIELSKIVPSDIWDGAGYYGIFKLSEIDIYEGKQDTISIHREPTTIEVTNIVDSTTAELVVDGNSQTVNEGDKIGPTDDGGQQNLTVNEVNSFDNRVNFVENAEQYYAPTSEPYSRNYVFQDGNHLTMEGPGKYNYLIEFTELNSDTDIDTQGRPIYVCYEDVNISSTYENDTINDTSILFDYDYFAGEALTNISVKLDGVDITDDARLKGGNFLSDGSSVYLDSGGAEKTWNYNNTDSEKISVSNVFYDSNNEIKTRIRVGGVGGEIYTKGRNTKIDSPTSEEFHISKILYKENQEDYNGDIYDVDMVFLSTFVDNYAEVTGLNTGEHTLTLEAEYNGNNDDPDDERIVTDSITFTVDANDAPTSDFSTSPIEPDVGESISFTDNSTDPEGNDSIIAWEWDFGDGTTEFYKDAAVTFKDADSNALYQVQEGDYIGPDNDEEWKLEEIYLNSHKVKVRDIIRLADGENGVVVVDGDEVSLTTDAVYSGNDADVTINGVSYDNVSEGDVLTSYDILIEDIEDTGSNEAGIVTYSKNNTLDVKFGDTFGTNWRYVEDNPQPNGTNPDTTHTYNSENIYETSLQVWDDNGLSDISYKRIAFAVDGRTVKMDTQKNVGSTPDASTASTIDSQAVSGRTVEIDEFPNVGKQLAPTGDFYYRNQTYIPYQDMAENYEIYVAQGEVNIECTLTGDVKIKQANHTHDLPRRDDFDNTDPDVGSGAENKEIQYSRAQRDKGDVLLDFGSRDEAITLDTTVSGNDVTITVANEDSQGNLTNQEQILASNDTATTTNTYQDDELYIRIDSSDNDDEFEVRNQKGDVSYRLAAEAEKRFKSASENQKTDVVSDGDGSEQKVITDVDPDLLDGLSANNYRVFIDDDPDDDSTNSETEITGDLYNGANDSGTPKDKKLDLSSYVDSPGWYRLKLVPDQATFTKARVFLDHHKDTNENQ